ncbi:putative hydro-lyase [uncultured Megasphaera sp.]|uniref:putative hydro-lyase n=1 Tax=uncultured Megasphaera sp. TaxID=165188 RepID=UPI0026036237|nr:putative hydro-lyase [uncultured Megasphaera sp.]
MDLAKASPAEVRSLIRAGELDKPTSGMCAPYAQANMAVLPKELAFDFLLFTQRNKVPCPVLDVTEAGSPVPKLVAPEADLRHDIPRYRIYRHGELTDEVTDAAPFWRDDLVAFLLGCSFSFEGPMIEAGLEIRHITDNHNVPMYKTNIECVPAGVFHGPMVVSMRPAPIHIGNPEAIGISDIDKPDFGERSDIKPGEVPVFWACGVTPQAVAMAVKPEFMITHAPGYMFITDVLNSQLSIM